MASTSLTGIIDYGVGNVRSVFNAIKEVGGTPVLTASAEELLACDRLILPGVGAFAHGMAELKSRGLDSLIRQAAQDGMPIMGICLGMQMLTRYSLEFGQTEGLGLADGVVSLIKPARSDQLLRLPHVAWKPLMRTSDEVAWLFKGISPEARFYFIHSYAVSCESTHVAATADYEGVSFGAVLSVGNVVGTQFHPEKSGPEGLMLLNNFVMKGM
jgi:glutamine amidotransferase